MPNNIRHDNNNTSNPFGASRRETAFFCWWLSWPRCPAASAAAARPADVVRFDLAADPRKLNPLFLSPDAASVEQQVARLAFEPFVDLDARGRPSGAAAGDPNASQRRPLGRRPDDRYRLRRGVLWSDGGPVTRRRRALHAARDPRSAQSGPLARRLRADRPRLRAADARTVVFHLTRAWAPAVTDVFLVRLFAAVRLAGARACRSQTPLAHAPFNAAPSVGDGPYRFVEWRRGEGLRYAANPRYWRGTPPVAGSCPRA